MLSSFHTSALFENVENKNSFVKNAHLRSFQRDSEQNSVVGTVFAIVHNSKESLNMKNFYSIAKINLALAFTLVFAFSATANAAKASARNISLVVSDLAQKLKVDLAESNLQVKLGNVKENKLAANVIEVKGQAFCVLPADKTQLPISFTAKVNTAAQTVADVQYAFVENSFAPPAEEEILMKELMKKISADYKTDQITIAIDGFETFDAANNQKNLKGIGEVKIGEVEWNKINFDVIFGADRKATKIVYNIK